MVYDKIDNFEIYKGLSEDIYEGLKFLKNATKELACGVYDISSRVKAIVSEYETKLENENGYEAHREYIDIQYLLEGEEKIYSLPIEKMQESTKYREDLDAAFYTASISAQAIHLGDGYFAIYYPQDGHMPCLCINNQMFVKKVVIKVKI